MNGSDEVATDGTADEGVGGARPAVRPATFEKERTLAEPKGETYNDPLRASVQTSARPKSLGGVPVPPAIQDALTPLQGIGKQYLAWIGSGLLILSLFLLPAKTYSYTLFNTNASASQSLWDYGTFWGVIILLLALASIGLAYIRDFQWLVVTGGVAFIILILNFLYAFSGVLGFSAHPSWGWIILFPSALIIMAAGAMRSTPRDAENTSGLTNVMASVQNKGASR